MRKRKQTRLVFLLIIIIISGVWLYNEKIKTNSNDCPDVIPEIIEVKDGFAVVGEGGYFNDYFFIEDYWKDGSKIEIESEPVYGYPYSECFQGSKEGENVNYYYCPPAIYTGLIEEIDKEGNILKKETNSYAIVLVLKPLGEITYQDNYVTQTGNVREVKTNSLMGPAYDYFTEYEVVSAKCMK